MTDDQHRRARDARDDAVADAWMREQGLPPLPEVRSASYAERTTDSHKLTIIADGRQLSGGDLLADSRDDAQLFAIERQEDNARHRLLRRLERRDFLAELTVSLTTDKQRAARIKRGLRLLRRERAEDIRSAIAATADKDLASLSWTFKKRRGLLAVVMGCSVATVNARITRGLRVLEIAIRTAKAGQAGDVQSSVAPKKPKRVKRNLRQATDGSKFDSEARRRAIASLTDDEQAILVRILEHKATVGEMEATKKADKKARTKMLPHYFNEPLDATGRSNDHARRMLANLPRDEAEALCADWLSETIDKAIGGTPDERRAAREKYDAQRYTKLVRKFVQQNAKAIA